MEYCCVTELSGVRDYLAGASVVGFDFETAPVEQYRGEERAALDAHKAVITGVSFSVAEGSGIYVPLRHRCGRNISAPEAVMEYLRVMFFENATVIKVAHNLAFESMFSYALGMVIQPPCYDTIAAVQLTLKSSVKFRGLADSGLKTLVPQLFAGITAVQKRRFQQRVPGKGALDARRKDAAARLALQVVVAADVVRVGVRVVDRRQVPAALVQQLADAAPRVLVVAAVDEADVLLAQPHQADLGGALDVVGLVGDLDHLVHGCLLGVGARTHECGREVRANSGASGIECGLAPSGSS